MKSGTASVSGNRFFERSKKEKSILVCTIINWFIRTQHITIFFQMKD